MSIRQKRSEHREWTMSRKPDFFIVGAAKSGTTSLYRHLIQHSAIFMPELKEPHFFGEWHPAPGVKDLEEYLSLFVGVPEEIQAGEATTAYLYSSTCAQEIKRFQPIAKIIMILRNPVDRAYSNYWEQRQGKYWESREPVETLGFEEALEAEPDRIKEGWGYAFHYIACGRYAEQVARYLDVFGNDAVRVYLFEDLVADAEAVCRNVFSFLEVEPDYPIKVAKAYNPSGPSRSALLSKLIYDRLSIKEPVKKVVPITVRRSVKEWLRAKNVGPTPKMNPETRSRLQGVFRNDILRLEKLIGRDLSNWLEM
jgi:Sulfotransferase domain